jgi:aryl-phospho-beta-D-glucosidase BglC (GH1 family)
MQVSVSSTHTWSDGKSRFTQYDVVLTNNAASSTTNPTINIRCDKVTQIWNVEPSSNQGTYMLPKWALDRGGILPNGGTFAFGFIATGTTPASVDVVSSTANNNTTTAPQIASVPPVSLSFEKASVAYFEEYPDVKNNGMEAWDHYVRYGIHEGRKWRGTPKPQQPQQPQQPQPRPTTANGKGSSYTARNGKIYMGPDAREIKINGINWFGLNTGTYSVHSLWITPIDEYISILKRGNFNAVRLTLSAHIMLNLDSLKIDGVNETVNPGMSGMTAGRHLDDLIERLARAGILVMLNMHRMTGKGDNAEDIGPLWYSDAYPQDRIVEAWVAIAKRYVNRPNVFAMDIKNEPHAATWGTNDPNTDFAAFCERVGNAILDVNPNVLIGVAGVTKCVWSDSVGPASNRPVVLNVPDKVFYTPHFYNVYKYWPNVNFQQYMDECVGNVVRDGLPVIVGEWGYNETDESDMRWLADFTKYMNQLGITNGLYWAINENAGEHHSILEAQSSKVKEFKLKAIRDVSPHSTAMAF